MFVREGERKNAAMRERKHSIPEHNYQEHVLSNYQDKNPHSPVIFLHPVL